MPLPKRVTNATRAPLALSSSPTRCPIQPSSSTTWTSATAPEGSRQSSTCLSPSNTDSSRCVVHGTVATVGMPSRSYTSARLGS
jgi:hypothetical protein